MPALVAIVVLTEIGLVRPNGVWAAAGLGILSCLALVWRRPRPLLATFVAGDAAILSQFLLYRTYHGSAMSPPVQHASIAAWGRMIRAPTSSWQWVTHDAGVPCIGVRLACRSASALLAVSGSRRFSRRGSNDTRSALHHPDGRR